MRKLQEQDQVPFVEMQAAMDEYAKAFPKGDWDWMHPCLLDTRQLRDLLLECVRRGSHLTADEVETRLGPISWDW